MCLRFRRLPLMQLISICYIAVQLEEPMVEMRIAQGILVSLGCQTNGCGAKSYEPSRYPPPLDCDRHTWLHPHTWQVILWYSYANPRLAFSLEFILPLYRSLQSGRGNVPIYATQSCIG